MFFSKKPIMLKAKDARDISLKAQERMNLQKKAIVTKYTDKIYTKVLKQIKSRAASGKLNADINLYAILYNMMITSLDVMPDIEKEIGIRLENEGFKVTHNTVSYDTIFVSWLDE